MIELKIDNSAAVFLLTERMRLELEAAKENKRIPEYVTFETMSYDQLLGFIERAVFDLTTLLPCEIMIEENNVSEIMTKAIRSLAAIFHKDDLKGFSINQTYNIIRPIEKLLKLYSENEDLFRVN